MEQLLVWVDYPESKPQQSGIYTVNIDNNNKITLDFAYFDQEKDCWLKINENDNEEQQSLGGVNAYNPYKIVPYIRPKNKQQ